MKKDVRLLYVESQLNNSELQSSVLDYEKDFEPPEKILTLESGCPICKSNIKGNKRDGFYCESCNFIFSDKSI